MNSVILSESLIGYCRVPVGISEIPDGITRREERKKLCSRLWGSFSSRNKKDDISRSFYRSYEFFQSFCGNDFRYFFCEFLCFFKGTIPDSNFFTMRSDISHEIFSHSTQSDQSDICHMKLIKIVLLFFPEKQKSNKKPRLSGDLDSI